MRPEPRFCWEASFLGGPIGGETRLVSERLPYIRIPAMARVNAVSSESMLHTPVSPTYDVAEYRLERTYGGGGSLVYRWVDPSAALRKQVAELKVKADKYDAIRKALA